MKPDRDVDRVTLDDEAALLYWTCRFDVSPDELEEAVDIVGDSVDAVAAYLNVGKGRERE
ncbi:DUF3606 domain-containing protein [Sphingobium sp. 3R8]|uniref:DUF3606 domain-containing protein n=1 Tax=Sphingomonas bisphenolicum TaxID=296544 RepID=A0ABM7FV03_9SPHN|nr:MULTISPECIES: DUF3606 domain-containing protein [Sphingomonadaceae]MBZ9649968.1 DUF3606 domain-containing protein [Sphingobium sp. 3R8]BBF68922.1 hypothetical protein SBA_ch1_11220 [Sphingomonas bisphenolicum]